MALSPAHRFGQIIGEVLEKALDPLLAEFAARHGLFLDRHGKRPARRGSKVTWMDRNGNAHDLDFVLERGGAGDRLGQPVAFIETAWRRYTKHSRNKAQEALNARTNAIPEELEPQGFDFVIRYTDGDRIEARFVSVEAAAQFLRKF